MSNFDEPVSFSVPRKVSPGTRSSATGAFCRTSFTWKMGACARLRSGLITRTSSSNGTSWWA
ncbi:hypothetical protein COSO111634_21235 [Corallococcus soli]